MHTITKSSTTGDAGNARARTFASRGLALAGSGDYTGAIAALTRAIALDPGDADSLVNRGEALRREGRLDEAIADFTRALAIAPRHWIALENRALAYRDAVSYREAIADATRLVRHDPTNPRFWTSLGESHRRQGHLRRALACFERANGLSGGSGPNAVANRALTLWQLGDPKCHKEFRAAIERYPDDYWLHAQYAKLLWQSGSADEALRAFDRAIHLDPARVWLYVWRGILQQQMGRTSDGERDFDTALKATPKALSVSPWLGEIELRRSHFKRAITWFDRTLAGGERSAHAFARTRRATCLLALGHSAQARGELRVVLEAHNSDRYGVTARAEALWLLGREREAVAMIARAVDRDMQMAFEIEHNVLLQPTLATAAIRRRLEAVRARAASFAADSDGPAAARP